jgi:ADP-ribose pyrophosphatase YjhB (NUDIX family)
MNNRPKLMITVFIFNSEGNKILIGKRYDETYWSILNGKLEYGEDFEDCASRILSTVTNILVDDSKRLKFICSYNAVDKSKNVHAVSIDHYIQLTKEEEKFYLMVDPFFYQTWSWYSYEELLKMQDNLFAGVQIFLKKFNIKKLEDIKNLVSN